MTINDFLNREKQVIEAELEACCGSRKWVEQLMKGLPFTNEGELIEKAESAWYDHCGEADWLEAFSKHPRIGDVKSLTEKFAGKEQSSVASASAQVIEALAAANLAYEKKFGFIFIVCATGKPADVMLRLLQDRLSNTREEELAIAMGEQHKITIIRLKKLISDGNWGGLKVSQLTSHVLDTSIGKPGKDISIRLKRQVDGNWQTFAQGLTDADGRVADILPLNRNLPHGDYQALFDTGQYFSSNNLKGFYPFVVIAFTVFDDTHYHVPLLINPFGYATYRGS